MRLAQVDTHVYLQSHWYVYEPEEVDASHAESGMLMLLG